jgi:hypothetical protein
VPSPAQAWAFARRLGLRQALFRSGYVLVNRPFALSVLDCLEIRREDLSETLIRAAADHERRFLEPAEAISLAGRLDPAAGRIVCEAADRGDACYALLERGEAINVGCYSPRPTPVLNDLVVHFDPPDWYMFGAYTPPAHRGRRLHGVGVVSAALELFERGVPALVTVCERTNYASLVSALRMGWKPCGTIYRIGIGRWTRFGQSAGARERRMRLAPRGQAETP